LHDFLISESIIYFVVVVTYQKAELVCKLDAETKKGTYKSAQNTHTQLRHPFRRMILQKQKASKTKTKKQQQKKRKSSALKGS
jgi:hypothetical protein